MYIQGEVGNYIVGLSPEEEERFKNKESKVLAIIALGVEPEHQIHILDCDKASDAWDTLQRAFEPKS